MHFGSALSLLHSRRSTVEPSSSTFTPKPKSAPKDGGDFIFEVCDDDGDDWDEMVLQFVLSKYPEAENSVNPLLFTCPKELLEKAVFSGVD